jgi:hypothetical protein
MDSIANLMELLNEYKEQRVPISPRSIMNTLKQQEVICSPYGLKYDNEDAMDLIVFYYKGARIEIALVNNFIVSIDEDTMLTDMSEFFMNCEVNFLDTDPSYWNIK